MLLRLCVNTPRFTGPWTLDDLRARIAAASTLLDLEFIVMQALVEDTAPPAKASVPLEVPVHEDALPFSFEEPAMHQESDERDRADQE